MQAKIETLKAKNTNNEEYLVYPRTLIKCVTNENGDSFEDTVTAMVDDAIAANTSISNIIDGTTQVGDSAKLGGQLPDYYADKTYVAEQIAGANHLTREIVTEIPTADTAEDNVIYMYKVDSATGSDVYQEYQLINGEVVLVGDTSVDLSGYALSTDLANYLPLTGGTISGNVAIKTDEAAKIMSSLSNSLRTTSEYISANGTYVLRDNTNSADIIRSEVDGTNTFNGTASGNLPLIGGTVDGRIEVNDDSSFPIKITNTTSGGTFSLAGFYNADSDELGALGFEGQHNPVYYANGVGSFSLLHEGNYTTYVTPANIGAAASSHEHSILSVQSQNYKQGTDLPSTYPRGATVFFSNNPTDMFNNIPYCTIYTIKGHTNHVCIQWLYPYNSNNDTVFYRTATYDSDTWREWQTVSVSGHTQAASTITAGTFGGDVVAPASTAYTTAHVANAVLTTTDPGEGASVSYPNGTLIFVYE